MDTNETTIYTAVLITGIVIGTIFIYFIITIYRNHRRHFKLLSRQFAAEMELLERERSRIASDLHDELGPVLAVTQIHLQAIDDLNDGDKKHLQKAEENIQQVTERLSGIAKNLTPKILITKGFEVALKDFTDQVKESGMLAIDLTYGIRSEVDILQSLHIYRMMQELIYNTIKHSGASEIKIILRERKSKIYFLYSDNGIGINGLNNKKEKAGLGLGSLRNRTEMLGGKMESSKVLTGGVEYFFEIPLKPMYAANNKSDTGR